MSETYNVYCDESCHLENDKKKALVIGGVFCPKIHVTDVSQKIRSLKNEYDMPKMFEIKWTKVSDQKFNFYKSIVDLFFDLKYLSFRAVIADKTDLNHKLFNQDHDTWYFKMYYLMLQKKIIIGNDYNIYIDIKDTRSADKVKKLHEVLCNTFCDFDCERIRRIQTVRSHEVELLQMSDLLIGILSSNINSDLTSPGKLRLIKYFKENANQNMHKNTPLWSDKINWVVWPKGAI